MSEKKIATIWELVRQRTDTFTANRLAAETPGLSLESTRAAFDVLRQRELLRVAGRSRGGGELIAVMPDASERDSDGA